MSDKLFASTIETILNQGSIVQTRNSEVIRKCNLINYFDKTPLVSIRSTAWRNAIREMEWFLSGSNNINDLHPKVHHWWEPWANKEGKINNNYSEQFRQSKGKSYIYPGFDQIEFAIKTLKEHPNSRRNVLTTWNAAEMASSDTPITNCHGTVIQLFVEPDNSLHITMYQRSADIILGVPHNWIQYWAFLQYMAHQGNKKVGSLTWIGGDCHIYKPHIPVAKKIVDFMKDTDYNKEEVYELIYTPTSDDFKAEDFKLNRPYSSVIKDKVEMVV